MLRFSRLQIVAFAAGLAAFSGCSLISQEYNAEGVRMYQQAYYEGALKEFQKASTPIPAIPTPITTWAPPTISWPSYSIATPTTPRPSRITITAWMRIPTIRIATARWPCC